MTPALRPDDDGTYVDMATFTADVAGEPTPPNRQRGQRRPRALLGLAGLAVGLGVVWSVYTMGDSTAALPANHPATTAPAATASASPRPLDEAKVAQWQAKVTADPADAATLRELAAEYFRVGRFAESAAWQAKIVAQNPSDIDSRLILGVAYYSDGRYDLAEEQWLSASSLDPGSADPWYNLGFLYLSLDPPDDARAEAAWRKVVELAPGSDIAATVSEHLGRLDTPLPGASATPTPTPSQ